MDSQAFNVDSLVLGRVMNLIFTGYYLRKMIFLKLQYDICYRAQAVGLLPLEFA